MKAAYLVVLAACVVATLPLELYFHARVYRRPRRWLLSLLPVVIAFTAWDVWAIARGHWDFDPAQTTGVRLPGAVPVEEVLFFVVVPTCAILTFETVRALTGWSAADERTRR